MAALPIPALALPAIAAVAIPLFLLLLGGTAQASPTPQQPLNTTPQPHWKRRVLERVSGHEGGYAAQNRNWDGAGLSYGILQWTQKHGNLGILLTALFHADTAAFRRIFGSGAGALLDITTADSQTERLSLSLWEAPWTDRFAAAGRHPAFQAAQVRLALTGDHWVGAVKAATALGSSELVTERSMALFFDTSVQQGPSEAVKLAREVHAALTSNGPVRTDYLSVLGLYAQRAANRARRLQPTKPTDRGTWREVAPGEWHRVIGTKYDYYADYRKRRFGIVNDLSLSDVPVSLNANA
jgi:hypothetical protein